MKILMLAPEPFFEPRGTPISVHLRLQQLAGLGHQVTLLTYHVGQNVPLANVRVHRIPRIWFIRRVRPGPSWAKPLLDALLFALAVKHLLQGGYHVLHTHEEAAILGMLLGALFRKPHIYDMHSSLPRQLAISRFGRLRPLVKAFEWLETRVLQSADGVITVDDELQAIVDRTNPQVPSVRLDNLPVQACGQSLGPEEVADIRARLQLDGRVCVVYSGTFEPYQGLDLLLDSASIVARQHPSILFVWIGGQPDQVSYWRHQVETRGLRRNVHLTGAVPLAESLAYLDLADILVSPRWAGMPTPLKIYTYLQAGKAIVATETGGHTRVLTPGTALLVEPAADALAAGLLRLAGDPNLRQLLGVQARAFAEEKFKMSACQDRLASLYRPLEWIAGTVPAQTTPG